MIPIALSCATVTVPAPLPRLTTNAPSPVAIEFLPIAVDLKPYAFAFLPIASDSLL